MLSTSFFIIVIQIHFDSANLSKIKKRNSNDAMGSCKWVLRQRKDDPFTCWWMMHLTVFDIHTYFGARMPNVNALMTYMDAVAHKLYDVKH